MSGTLPPNYNPNDSLLSGGDAAKIIPVQGGGFLANGNYNADASLLSGGENVKIEPVQGGGAKTNHEIYDEEVKQYHKDMEKYQEEMKQYTKDKEQYDREIEKYKKEEKRLTNEDEKRRREKYEAELAEYNKLKASGSAVIPPPPTIDTPTYPKPTSKRPEYPTYPKRPSYPVRRVEISPFSKASPKLNVTEEEENEENNNNNTTLNSENISFEASENNNDELSVTVLDNESEVLTSADEESKKGDEKEEKTKQVEIPCPAPDSDDTEVEDLADAFESNEEAVDSKTKEVIRLMSREFFIRHPKRKSAGDKKDDGVMSDWKEQKFTSEEADFLNTLGFSPKLIYSSFYCHKKDWKEELAEFLYYLSMNSCYPASSLLLKGECQRVREFLMIVESNLNAEQLRKLAEKPIPVAGPITLPDLEESEEEEDNENNNNNGNSADLGSIKERMGKLNVDDVVKETERKSVAAKIAGFFKGFFKGKPAKKNAEEEILKELENVNDDSPLATPLLNTEEENTSVKNIQERKAKIKTLEEERLEEAFQEFLTRIPVEFRGMDPQILKKKYLSKAF